MSYLGIALTRGSVERGTPGERTPVRAAPALVVCTPDGDGRRSVTGPSEGRVTPVSG